MVPRWLLVMACWAPSEPPLHVQARAAQGAIAACLEGDVGALTADVARAGPLPVDHETLVSDCGPAAMLYEQNAATLGNTSRSADTWLIHLARLQEDLAYLDRVVRHDSTSDVRVNAVQHALEALTGATRGTLDALAAPPEAYEGRGSADAWVTDLVVDATLLGTLPEQVERLALDQGMAHLVRTAQLASSFRAARGMLAARRAALPEDAPDAWTTYLDASEALIGLCAEATAAMLEAPDGEARAAWRTRLANEQNRWAAAHAAATEAASHLASSPGSL